MDKIVEELLHPFARRLAASSVGALLLFWGIGLLLFHFFHPQPFPGCRTGGTDLCGLFSGDAKRVTVAGLCLLVAVVATSLAVFSRAAQTAQFLSGVNWRHLRGLGVLVQQRARRRATDRAHPDREIQADAPDRRRPMSGDGRGNWRRYPHGTPRGEHDDPPRATDVPLEPTRLGNVFAAARQRVLSLDGLSLLQCGQVLLSVLPQQELARLKAGSGDLLLRTQTFTFCVLTSAWAVWLPGWPWKVFWVLTWLTIAYLTYREMCSAAGRYCDSLEAIITVNRSLLFEGLRLPPLSPTIDEQRRRAEQLGVYGPYVPPNLGVISLPRHENDKS